MYNNYFNNFKPTDYVSVMQSCLGVYVEKGSLPNKVVCYTCGLFDTKIIEGKVSDIKQKQLKMRPKSKV